MNCSVCLNENTELTGIFDEAGEKLNIFIIVTTHLQFLEDQLKNPENSQICQECWTIIKNFHLYFNEIQEKHYLGSINTCSGDNTEIEDDLNRKKSKVLEIDLPETATTQDSTSSDESIKQEPIKRSKSKKIQEEREQSEKLISEHCQMVCENCPFKFRNFEEMKDHYRTEHNTEGFLQCCFRKFYKFTKILSHVKWHANPNVYQCLVCNKSYREKSSLMSHRETHDKKTIQCTFPGCNRLYSTQNQLKVHSKKAHIVDNQKPLECDLCSKTFPSKGRLRDHHRAVHNAMKFVCDLCGKIFNQKGNLQYHRKGHLEDQSERVQCKICSHWLKNKEIYKKHIKKHDEEKQKNICSYCSKNCPNVKALKSHIYNVHLAERKFKCGYCQKAFKKKVKMEEHVAALHTGEARFECDFCSKVFNYQAHMQTHRKKSHPKEWEEHCKPKYLIPP